MSESAVVGYPHDVKGEGIFAYVVLKDKGKAVDRSQMDKELKSLCKTTIASYAMPDFILVSFEIVWKQNGLFKFWSLCLRMIVVLQRFAKDKIRQNHETNPTEDCCWNYFGRLGRHLHSCRTPSCRIFGQNSNDFGQSLNLRIEL